MSDKLHAGWVIIELGDEEITLKPTARAVDKLERAYGDLMTVFEGLSRFKPRVFVDVIMAGAAMKPSERETLGEQVYSAGYVDLVAKLTRFVTILGNGGRPPKEEQADEDERDDPKNPE